MVVVTNLNRRLDGPQDKAVQEGKPVNKGFTGPTRPAQDFNRPDPFFGKFDTNIRSDTFYEEFPLVDAQQAQANYDVLQGSYGNSFSDPTISQRVDDWITKYDDIYGPNTAAGKGLIEDNMVVRPENLGQLASEPSTSGNGVQNPNVTGKFPSNSVAV